MKKQIVISILLVSLVLLSACAGGKTDEGGKTSPAPTQQTVLTYSQALEALLSEEEALPFEDCARKVVSLKPGVPGPVYDEGEGSPADGPNVFSVDGDMIYVSDGMALIEGETVKSMFGFDMAKGDALRFDYGGDPLGYMPMIAFNGLIYTSHSILDPTTGESTALERCVTAEQEIFGGCFMTTFDGRINFIVGVDEERNEAKKAYIATLDTEKNEWSAMELFCEFQTPLSGLYLKGVFPDGTLLFELERKDASKKGQETLLVHTDKEGNLIAYTELPYSAKELEYAGQSTGAIVAADGSVYYMACLEEEFVIYRINL